MASHQEAILDMVREHHAEQEGGEFVPGSTPILSSGAVLDAEDRAALVAAALDLRIAAGPYAQQFERFFARYLGVRRVLLTNSGSSANLLALTALTARELGDRRLRPGDEVITVAAGFPTTVNPIVQNQLVPVFVDIDPRTYNTTAAHVEAAIGPRTRAIMVAHAFGNPFEAAEIAALAQRHGLWLIEDNCDAVGSRYGGELTGTFGHLSTVSFYPAHHITMGEGGCVATDDLALARLVESYRDWGRDCWCKPGEDNKCRKRFGYEVGTLPPGYDHKYIFSHLGYNLKTTDLQAALGLSQLAKIDDFGERRKRNWHRLRTGLDGLPGLRMPEATPGSDPSWFSFVLSVEPDAPFGRSALRSYLEQRQIRTRALFSGNLVRHPAYDSVEYRVAGELEHSDAATEQTICLGVYPGINDRMIEYMVGELHAFVRART
ncbi:lipopolysaccharide biosynthesis protein RfbH [Saccharopolyspora sp. CA-218241]|uniref:lipopolysaccharide biosynthesis protein RfbH n=1 Tax=Saccharopolyspora sp. CA-218241 TaxID=3240027 RepID=UPI003D963417